MTASNNRTPGGGRRYPYAITIGSLLLIATGAIAYGSLPGSGPEAEPQVSLALRQPVVGLTSPAREIELASLVNARVADIRVREGQRVTAGAPLVLLDYRVQQARTERARQEAESRLPIDLARVRMEYAQRELKRLEGLKVNAVTSVKELLDAEAQAEITRLEFDWAKVQHDFAVQEYKTQQALLTQYALSAPFAGTIARIDTDSGATVEEQQGILTLVQLDPLKAVIDVPLEAAALYTVGERCQVMRVGKPNDARLGTITFASPVAEAGSQTVRVKVEVPNPERDWRAGTEVYVALFAESDPSLSERGAVGDLISQADVGARVEREN